MPTKLYRSHRGFQATSQLKLCSRQHKDSIVPGILTRRHNATSNSIGKVIILVIITFCIGIAKPAFSKDGEQIALILSLDENKINTASIDFFQSTKNALSDVKSWRVTDQGEVTSQLKSNNTLTSIPVISRKSLLQAAPISKKKGAKKIIPAVQKAIDTLALDGAILVDCVPAEQNSISSCRLFYYDRVQARITASSEKKFLIAINDASRWSKSLVVNLQQGISEEKHRREQKQISQFMEASSDPERDKGQPQLGLGIYGEYHNPSHSSLSTLSALSLLPAWDRNGHSIGVEINYGTERGESEGKSEVATKKSIGLAFATSSKALDILIWQLGITSGFSERTLKVDGAKVLSQRQPFITILPGLLFSVSKHISAGIEMRAQNYFGGNKQTKLGFDGSFANSTLGFGFNVKFTL